MDAVSASHTASAFYAFSLRLKVTIHKILIINLATNDMPNPDIRLPQKIEFYKLHTDEDMKNKTCEYNFWSFHRITLKDAKFNIYHIFECCTFHLVFCSNPIFLAFFLFSIFLLIDLFKCLFTLHFLLYNLISPKVVCVWWFINSSNF